MKLRCFGLFRCWLFGQIQQGTNSGLHKRDPVCLFPATNTYSETVAENLRSIFSSKWIFYWTLERPLSSSTVWTELSQPPSQPVSDLLPLVSTAGASKWANSICTDNQKLCDQGIMYKELHSPWHTDPRVEKLVWALRFWLTVMWAFLELGPEALKTRIQSVSVFSGKLW